MSIDLDGMAILNAASRRPDMFPTVSDAINELARKTVEARLAAKDMKLELWREIAAMIAEGDLLQVLDGMSPKKVGDLARKLDKENQELKQADAQSHRRHLLALAMRLAEPREKPVKPPRASVPRSVGPSRPKSVKRTLHSKAMKARYKGKFSDTTD